MGLIDTVKRNKRLAETNSQLVQQILTTLSGKYYSQSDINAFFAIGSANKQWMVCIFEGGAVATDQQIGFGYDNINANDATFVFGIPLLIIMGTKNLIITQIKVGLAIADANDFLSRMRMLGWSDHDTFATIDDSNSDFNTPQEITYNITDRTIGGVYERIAILLNYSNAGGLAASRVSYVQVEYYYV